MRPESTNPGHRVGWPALLAMGLVPLLAVAALIGLAGNDNDERVQAAVVNLDEPVTVADQYVPMGRQLAAAIIERDGDNISWTLADAKNAKDGLESGRYAAVVTIPEEFSAAATSFSANDAAVARQATIDVAVSENAPVTDAAVAQEIARLASDAVNSTLTEGYLDNVYVGFNTVQEQFTTIVDGAEQLSEGAAQLADGTGQTSDGAAQLADGMAQLADGSVELNAGGSQLADGGTQLLAGGNLLAAGGGELADGGSQLADGAHQLSDGVGELAGQVPALVDGVGELVDGAEPLLGGIPGYTAGTKQVVAGVSELKGGLDQVIAGLDAPMDFTELQPLVDGARGLSAGLEQVDGALQGFVTGEVAAPAEVRAIGGQVAAAYQCPVEDPEVCAMLAQTFAAGAAAGVDAGFRAGTGTASTILNAPDPTSGASVLDGAAQLSDGVGQLATALPAQITTQMAPLRDGLQQLSDGAGELVAGAQPLVDNADALGSGATQLLGGMRELDRQLAPLPGGVDQLADGASEFANGADRYAEGVETFSDGLGEYVDGVDTYTDGASDFVDGVALFTRGVGSAADGAQRLGSGIVELDSGAEQLADGVETFASELSRGAEQVPTYSDEQRATLASVVASPVSASDELSSTNAVALVSLLLVSALWAAGLASYVVARAVPSDIVSSRTSSIALWARTVAVPAMIAAGLGAVLGVIGSVVTEQGFGRAVGLVALLAALGISFVLVNHALAAWFGNVGRGISVLLLVATVALGVTSTVPAWLAAAAGYSPVQNGLELVRAWLADGSGIAGLIGMAILVAAIAFGLSYLAIAARRQLTADQFRRRLTT